MNMFIAKLAIAVIPFIMLIASITVLAALSDRYTGHIPSWRRTRRIVARGSARGEPDVPGRSKATKKLFFIGLLLTSLLLVTTLHNGELNRNSAVTHSDAAPALSATAYREVLNGLFAAEGR